MPISEQDGDEAILAELGGRLRALRLRRNVSQQELADEASVGRMTVQRLEQGGSASLTSVIRLLRALGATEGLEQLIPAPAPTPIDALEREGRQRQRARSTRAGRVESRGAWRWGDEPPAGGA